MKPRKPVVSKTDAVALLRSGRISRDLIAAARTAPVPLPVLRLLRVVACAVVGIHASVGGGIAVLAHGYSRSTNDVDVFIKPGDARRFAARLRAAGLRVAEITDAHWIAYYADDNAVYIARNELPEFRVDILRTWSEPEATSIRTADVRTVAGVSLPIHRAHHLVAQKAMADREKDREDVRALLRTGSVDEKQARYVVYLADEERLPVFDALAAQARATPRPNPRYVSVGRLRRQFRKKPLTAT